MRILYGDAYFPKFNEDDWEILEKRKGPEGGEKSNRKFSKPKELIKKKEEQKETKIIAK